MSNQSSTLETKYLDLKSFIEAQLCQVTSWLDSYANSSDAHNCRLFQQNMDRQFKLRADLARIEARLAAYAQIEPFAEAFAATG